MNTEELEELMDRFVARNYPSDLMVQLTLGHFLLWYRKKQEAMNGKSKTTTTGSNLEAGRPA